MITYTTPFKLPSLPGYRGGKSSDGTVQTLINQIPPHDTYIEPFLGGGSIMKWKRPASHNIGIELDELIAEVWMKERPQGIDIIHGDAFTHLSEPERLPRNTFLFVDPPYVKETLARGRAGYYAHNFTHEQHVQLASLLKRCRCMVMVCSLPNVLYENLYGGWRSLQYRNKTRRGIHIEQLWMNYPEPHSLHDYRYVGDSFRRRERLARVVRSLASLAPLERKAVLAQLKTRLA